MDSSEKRLQTIDMLYFLKNHKILFVVCFLFSIFSIKLSAKTIKVAFFPLSNFMTQDAPNEYSGYLIDYLNKISEYTGWTYEYIHTQGWGEAQDFLLAGKVDFIAPVEFTDERNNLFGFAQFSIGTEYGSLLTNSNRDDLVYEDFDSFANLRIGYVKDVIFKGFYKKYANENKFTANLSYEFENTTEMMKALEENKIDAVVVNLMYNSSNTKLLAKFSPAPIYITFNRKNKSIGSKLDEALSSIILDFPEFQSLEQKKWFPSYVITPFSKAELNFIEQAPVFSIACVPGRPPVSFTDDNGNVSGINRDILNLISEKSGLKFSYHMLPYGHIDFSTLIQNNSSLISSVEYNTFTANSPIFNMSAPYFSSRKIFVGDKKNTFKKNDKTRLAVATGSETLISELKLLYPQITILTYDTIKESFEAVKNNKADFLIQTQYAVEQYIVTAGEKNDF